MRPVRVYVPYRGCRDRGHRLGRDHPAHAMTARDLRARQASHHVRILERVEQIGVISPSTLGGG